MQILVKPTTAAMPSKNEKKMRNKIINICINPTKAKPNDLAQYRER